MKKAIPSLKKNRLEQNYRNSQNEFKTVFEYSSLGHKFIDADLKIIEVNKALVKLLGYSKEELLGSRITDIVVPEFADSWKELQIELWTNRKPSFVIDTCIFRKDRSIAWFHVTSILLEKNDKTLGYIILEDISEQKKMERELKDAIDRERLFEQQLLDLTIIIQEKERARIAEDLHNSLGQLLYGVKLNLDLVKFGSPELQMQNISNIKNTQDLLTVCIKESRRISYDLMPPILEDFGLKVALQEICNQLSRTIKLKYEFSGLENRLSKYMEISIYRIVQELAMNLIKHAQATKASLKMGITKKDVMLTIEDNGKGFDTVKLREDDHIGIRSIKTKISLLRGKIIISSAPGIGTKINIRLPVR